MNARHLQKLDNVSRIYLKSVLLLLLITAFSKLLMSFEHVEVLRQPAPGFLSFISFQKLLLGSAILELVVLVIGWVSKSISFSLMLIAGLAGVFIAYRISLWMCDFQGYCGCLGNLTEVLHLDQRQAFLVSEGILIYLAVGSGLLLFLRAWLKRKVFVFSNAECQPNDWTKT